MTRKNRFYIVALFAYLLSATSACLTFGLLRGFGLMIAITLYGWGMNLEAKQ